MTDRNFDNRTLFGGDNINFMRAMNSDADGARELPTGVGPLVEG